MQRWGQENEFGGGKGGFNIRTCGPIDLYLYKAEGYNNFTIIRSYLANDDKKVKGESSPL